MSDTATEPNVRKLPGDLEFLTPNCPICCESTTAYPDGLQCDHCGIAWDSDGTNPERLDPDAKQCTSLYQPHSRCSHPSHTGEPEYRCWGDVDHNSKHFNPDAFYEWSTSQQTGEAES